MHFNSIYGRELLCWGQSALLSFKEIRDIEHFLVHHTIYICVYIFTKKSYIYIYITGYINHIYEYIIILILIIYLYISIILVIYIYISITRRREGVLDSKKVTKDILAERLRENLNDHPK